MYMKARQRRRRKNVPCPLCGMRVKSVYHVRARIGDYDLSIGKCSECRLALQTPQPSQQESIDYMNWRYSSTDPQDRYITDAEGKKRICRDRLRWLSSFSLPNKRLLDIGAGNGAFCSTAMEFGYEVTGTETSRQAVKRAKEMFGVQLIYGDIDSIPRNPQFGIVTMWDVIEHLRDPLKMLTEARARMVEGGLIIIATGNYESLSRLAMRERWGQYLFDHMFYFSPSSLEKLVHRAGFSCFQLHQLPSSESILSIKLKGILVLRHPRVVFKRIRQQLAVAEAKIRWPEYRKLDLLLVTARNYCEGTRL